jgi:hypothetical protein
LAPNSAPTEAGRGVAPTAALAAGPVRSRECENRGVSTSNDPRQSRTSDVRIRRAPKFPVFLIMGGGLGAVVTFILTAIYPVDPNVGFGALFGYFALYGVTGGVLLGALVAIILDRRADRRSTAATVVVERTEVPDVAETPEAPASDGTTPPRIAPVDDSRQGDSPK